MKENDARTLAENPVRYLGVATFDALHDWDLTTGALGPATQSATQPGSDPATEFDKNQKRQANGKQTDPRFQICSQP